MQSGCQCCSSWSPGWVGLLFFPPLCVSTPAGELFVLAPQCIFVPFFDHDTSGAVLSPHSDVLHLVVVHLVPSLCWALPIHHSCSFIKVWVLCSAEDSSDWTIGVNKMAGHTASFPLLLVCEHTLN